MKRKLNLLIVILLVLASLTGCKDPYEGAIVGAWQDSNRLVGMLFYEDGTCDVTYAREFITDTVSCAYFYTDGSVVLYNPQVYSKEDFDLDKLYLTPAEQGVVFFIDQSEKDGVIEGFWLISLRMEKSNAVSVQSFSEWSNGLATGGTTLNDAATLYTGSIFTNDVIDWIQAALNDA